MFVRAFTRARLIAAITLCAVGASAGDDYDGRWEGEGKPSSACSESANITFVITKGQFSQFALIGPRGRASLLSASLNDDGTATLQYGARTPFQGSLRFQGSEFSGTMNTLCGSREFTGRRVK